MMNDWIFKDDHLFDKGQCNALAFFYLEIIYWLLKNNQIPMAE